MSAAAPPPPNVLPAGSRQLAATPAPLWPTWLAMLALAVLVFLPAALGAALLQFDDRFFFGPDNPELRAGVRAVLTQPIANAWLPVAHLSLWLDFASAGTAPLWPHLHALLLHGAVGAVVVRLLLQLSASRLVAHAAGAWFVVHPALAESVAWVSSRKDLLCGLFVFAALHAAARLARRPTVAAAAGLAAAAALAMLSKATAVVLPLFALLVGCRIGRGWSRWLPALVAAAAVAPLALVHQAIAAAEGTLISGALAGRLPQAGGAFWHYLGKALWPCGLNVLYPEVDTLASFRATAWIGAGALGAVLAAAAATWRTGRGQLVGLGLFGFVAALLPFNTVWPGSSIAAADRYLYLAVPWLGVAAAAALAAAGRAVLFAAAAVSIPALAWLAGSRAHDFRTDETLWRASLAVEPRNAVAHLNLVYDAMQRPVLAVDALRAHLEAAVAAARYPIHELRARLLLVPLAMASADYDAAAEHGRAAVAAAEAQLARETAASRRAEATTLWLRANLLAVEPLLLAGDADGAEACRRAAEGLAPDDPDVIAFAARRALAVRSAELGERARRGLLPRFPDDDAQGAGFDDRLGAALERHPGHANLWLAQAEWDHARDRVLPALRAYRRAQAAEPQQVAAWLGAARLMREREHFEDALRYARDGLQHRADPALRQELALALVGLGRLDDAERHLEAYLQLRPGDRDTARVLANVLVGRAYARLADPGARPEVRRLIERALACYPDEAKADLVLARLAHEERDFAAAVRHAERCWRALPDLDEARDQYARSLAALGYQLLLRRDDDGAAEAWRRCLSIAPPGFVADDLDNQLRRIWARTEARGVELLAAGERAAAIAAFRRCLELDPEQHWPAWLLATALHQEPDADLGELERLCRQAVQWQLRHELDASQQVYLLAVTLQRQGAPAAARAVAAEFLPRAGPDARPQVIEALRRIAAD